MSIELLLMLTILSFLKRSIQTKHPSIHEASNKSSLSSDLDSSTLPLFGTLIINRMQIEVVQRYAIKLSKSEYST